MSLYVKCYSVIDSCVMSKQIQVAEKYLDIAKRELGVDDFIDLLRYKEVKRNLLIDIESKDWEF